MEWVACLAHGRDALVGAPAAGVVERLPVGILRYQPNPPQRSKQLPLRADRRLSIQPKSAAAARAFQVPCSCRLAFGAGFHTFFCAWLRGFRADVAGELHGAAQLTWRILDVGHLRPMPSWFP